MKNDFEVRGDVVAIFLDRRDGSKEECLISTKHLEKVQQFPNKWCMNGHGYVSGFYPNNRKNRIEWILHRYIIDAPENMLVDHRDMNRLNNIEDNLRVTDKSGNAQNVKARKTSSTGLRGVSYYKANKKWGANLTVGGKRKFLGLFNSPEEADTAVRNARAELMPFSQEAI